MTQQITLGGGCFWCIEGAFKQVRGVLKAQSGYAGGRHANPTYEEVCLEKDHHHQFSQRTVSDKFPNHFHIPCAEYSKKECKVDQIEHKTALVVPEMLRLKLQDRLVFSFSPPLAATQREAVLKLRNTDY